MVMSSMYRAAPVTLSRPSLRGTDLPMMCSSVIRSPKPMQMLSVERRARRPSLHRMSHHARHGTSINLPPCGSSAKLTVGKHALSPQICRSYNAVQRFSQVRRHGMAIMQPLLGHDELRFWFEDHEVGIKSYRNAAFARGAPSKSRRLLRHPPR